jgi:hypothetical protein
MNRYRSGPAASRLDRGEACGRRLAPPGLWSHVLSVAESGPTAQRTETRPSGPGYRLVAAGREAAEDERLALLEQIYDPVSRRRHALVQPGWRCLARRSSVSSR